MNKDRLIVCRCEEISREEILLAIRDGHHTVDSIKKATRAGMGACQGRTCSKLIQGILLEQGVRTPENIASGKARFPIVPCSVDSFSGEEE
ncbi:MAG: (2Fe-2S)-binding protein [Bacillota bacterium]